MTTENRPQLRLTTVLQRMSELVAKDEKYVELFLDPLDKLLEEVKEQKGFGVQGQFDPRGNATQGVFSLNHVAGVDDECPHGEFTTRDCELRIQHGVCGGCGRQQVYPK